MFKFVFSGDSLKVKRRPSKASIGVRSPFSAPIKRKEAEKLIRRAYQESLESKNR